MRFAKIVRCGLLCALAVFFWLRPNSLRAQVYNGDCQRFDTMEDCCDDVPGTNYCTRDNCINEIEGSAGDGQDTEVVQSAGCVPEFHAPTGSCPNFSEYVPAYNPDCVSCGGTGNPCYSDDDCCDDLICSNDTTGEPLGVCKSYQ